MEGGEVALARSLARRYIHAPTYNITPVRPLSLALHFIHFSATLRAQLLDGRLFVPSITQFIRIYTKILARPLSAAAACYVRRELIPGACVFLEKVLQKSPLLFARRC